MSDPVDSANDAAQFANDLALHQHLKGRARSHQVWVGGVVLCGDCGAAIPSGRLLAIPDCSRCVDCQEIFEREERLCR
jgi:phage/conjugal plasmid C-4 type zinc finger TraR family protein